jgi:HK97 family phage major capsid protein
MEKMMPENTPAEQKALHEQLLQDWAFFKEALELQQKEVKKYGEASQEATTKLDTINTRLDEVEGKMNRPDLFQKAESEEQQAEREMKHAHKTFVKALRKGLSGLDEDEKKMIKMVSLSEAKALNLGDDTAGGYLATPQYVQDILKTVVLYTPMRDVCRVEQTNNRSLQIPSRTGLFAAQWVSETGQRSETKGLTYGLEDIPNFEMYAEVLASEQMLEDAAFDIAGQIMMETALQFAVAEGKAFLSGTAAGQPEGILTNPYIQSVVSGNASALTYAGFVNTAYALKDYYSRNAAWLMQRQTIGSVRQILDSSNRPLWDPGSVVATGFTNPAPPNILGSPVIQAPDMPAVAASSFPVLYGDFNSGYIIVDRVAMVVKRLIEKYAETGQIAFLTRKRVGGQVVMPEAILKMQVHT